MTVATIANNVLVKEVQQLIHEGRRVVIPVKGKSMLPFLREKKDKVVLMAADELKVGDIVLARLSNEMYVLHRILRLEGEDVTLMGDGNVYGKENCKRADVLAKVVTILRNGHEIDCNNNYERRKVVAWRWFMPIRRYLLFFYRLCFM